MPHKLSEDPAFRNTCQQLGYHKTGFLCTHKTDNLMYKHQKWKQHDITPTHTFKKHSNSNLAHQREYALEESLRIVVTINVDFGKSIMGSRFDTSLMYSRLKPW